MPDLTDADLELCRLALAHSVDLHRSSYRPDHPGALGDQGVLRTAARLYYGALNPITNLRIRFNPQPSTGESMAQFPVDEPGPITAVVETLDRRGNVVPNAPGTEDDVRFSLSVEGPVTLTDLGDGRTAQLDLNEVGDTVLTAEVTTINGPVSITEAVQVIPAGIAAMRITLTTPQA